MRIKVNRVRVTQRGWDALNRTSTAPFTANEGLTVYIDYHHKIDSNIDKTTKTIGFQETKIVIFTQQLKFQGRRQ